MAIPNKIRINREEDYHTHFIGSYAGGQFMGFVTATLPMPLLKDWKSQQRWYAVLHTFTSEGRHKKTDAWFAGTTAEGVSQVLPRAQQKLDEMLLTLDGREFDSVEVELFSVQVDGHTFGLVDDSKPDKDIVSVRLLPNDLTFLEPWDGEYYT
jgi:formate hydrogenlyase regulatory protein HycA